MGRDNPPKMSDGTGAPATSSGRNREWRGGGVASVCVLPSFLVARSTCCPPSSAIWRGPDLRLAAPVPEAQISLDHQQQQQQDASGLLGDARGGALPAHTSPLPELGLLVTAATHVEY